MSQVSQRVSLERKTSLSASSQGASKSFANDDSLVEDEKELGQAPGASTSFVEDGELVGHLPCVSMASVGVVLVAAGEALFVRALLRGEHRRSVRNQGRSSEFRSVSRKVGGRGRTLRYGVFRCRQGGA